MKPGCGCSQARAQRPGVTAAACLAVAKYPVRSSFTGGRLTWACGFRPWLAGCLALGLWPGGPGGGQLLATWWQGREEQPGSQHPLQARAPQGPASSSQARLLKAPPSHGALSQGPAFVGQLEASNRNGGRGSWGLKLGAPCSCLCTCRPSG